MNEESITQYDTPDEASVLFNDLYPVNPPFGYVGIEINEETGKQKYILVEPTLNDLEERILHEIKNSLLDRVDIPLSVLNNEDKMNVYLNDNINNILKRYKGQVANESKDKFIYYLLRDFMGYGKIDLLLRDPKIEDISCNGVNIPLYIYHQNIESIPTNIIYETEEELDSIITRLAYKSGRQISVAHPILEGTLPEGYRVHLTLDEVSKRGSTFTIRKYRTNPFTIIDLINMGTMSPKIASYLWVMVENLRSIMICGATASGKTALLNSLCMFINPEMKVVTIEEVRELRLRARANWIPMITRPSFQSGVQEITTFDLLKSALRQRPDFIIVGEVRGEEAYTLFQSISVGHGGLCTIHADSVKSVIKRLMSRPMNVPEMMLPLMNVLLLIRRVKIGEKIVRRVETVAELTGFPIARAARGDEGVEIQNRFEWNSEDDTFEYHEPDMIDVILDQSKDIISLISEINHIPLEKLEEEQSRREIILKWMVKKGYNDYEKVSQVIRDYYGNPEEVFNSAKFEVRS